MPTDTPKLADYRDCLELAGAIADSVNAYDSDDALEPIIPHLQPVIGEAQELRKDKERLDWLEHIGANPRGVTVGGICYWAVEIGRKRLGEGDNLREAIDDAMKSESVT